MFLDMAISETSVADLCRIAGRETDGVSGTLVGGIKGSGTLSNPSFDASLQLNRFNMETHGGAVEPADATLELAVREHRLSIHGKVMQPEIEPILITGEFPVDPSVGRDRNRYQSMRARWISSFSFHGHRWVAWKSGSRLSHRPTVQFRRTSTLPAPWLHQKSTAVFKLSCRSFGLTGPSFPT